MGLLGFSPDDSGSVRIDAPTLERALTQALPLQVPANVEAEADSRVQVHISYAVQHLPSAALRRVESLLQQHMQLVGRSSTGVNVYDVPVHEIESQIDQLYSEHFSGAASSDGADRPPLVMMLLRPDKARMNPSNATAGGDDAPYIYRYRYHRGGATQQWIAQQRYVFADLSAGPCAYGPVTSGEGSVRKGSVPLIPSPSGEDGNNAEADAATAPSSQSAGIAPVQFSSEVTSFILSAVRHVFVGDVQWRNMHFAEKVLVPIVVFRNHRQFHPLRQEGGTDTLITGEDGAHSK